MSRLKKEIPFLVLLLALFVLPTLCHRISPPVQEPDGSPVLSSEVQVPIGKAQAKAWRSSPRSRLIKSELEHEQGTAAYEVTLLNGDRQKVVLVNASNGSVRVEKPAR